MGGPIRCRQVSRANIGSSFQLGTISQGAGNLQSSVDLSGLSGLQSMSAGTQADFRFVLWGAGYGANYSGFNSFQSGADLIVNGTVAAVPEPSMWVLAAGGGLCCVAWNAFRRRTRPVRDGRYPDRAHSAFVWSRRGDRNPIGCGVAPVRARSARISPTTLANLKPCPEKPAAMATCGCSGWRPSTKW